MNGWTCYDLGEWDVSSKRFALGEDDVLLIGSDAVALF